MSYQATLYMKSNPTLLRTRSAVHAAECPHRVADCPMEGCGAAVVYKELGRHIEQAHVRPAAAANLLLYFFPGRVQTISPIFREMSPALATGQEPPCCF